MERRTSQKEASERERDAGGFQCDGSNEDVVTGVKVLCKGYTSRTS